MRVALHAPRSRAVHLFAALAAAAVAACSGGGSGGPGGSDPGPDGLTATPVTSSRVSIAWTDSFADETGFLVERSESASGPFAEVTTAAADEVSIVDPGLAPSTTYYYRVAAQRPSRRTAFSGPVGATTPSATVGTISVNEVRFPEIAALGQGLVVGITFVKDGPAPVAEETPGSITGCTVWELTPSQVTSTTTGLDRGTLTISAGDSTPVIPPCSTPGSGYLCVGLTGTGGVISSAGPGAFAFTDLDATFADQDVGRHLRVSGAANPANDGLFPLVAVLGPNTVVAASAGANVAETLPATASWAVVAGQGAVTGIVDPGLLEDDDSLTFTLAATSGMDAIDSTVAVGDAFSLDAASTALLSSVPNDGTEFTLACDTGQCGAGTGTGTILEIRTTDASVVGMPAWVLPPPTTKSVLVRCVGFGSSITVPAAVSAYLTPATSGATRLQTTFIRTGLDSPQVGEPITILAGHALIGITTR
jgi:hypothetical protein